MDHSDAAVILSTLALLFACSSSSDAANPSSESEAGASGAVTARGGATAIAGTAGTSSGGASSVIGSAGSASSSGGTAGALGSEVAGSGGSLFSSGGGAGSASFGGSSTVSGGASGGGSGGGSTGASHWVGTWTASPYPVPSGNLPPASLSGSVLRQVTHVSLGGSQIRVQLSNLSGNGSVSLSAVHVAVCKAAGAVDSTIDPATDKALTFAGTSAVTIPAGKEIWSDPLDFTIAPLGNLTITAAFTSVPSNLTGHAGSRTTSYQQSGSTEVTAASMTSARTVDSWYYISGIDVMADAAAEGAVAIGDSITDGRGTDTNQNNRWTDVLASRLHANAATVDVSMMNQGIGATNLVGSGTAAEARFARDVLGQSGVKYAIVLDGVNDIGSGQSFANMKAAYDQLISAAHAHSVRIYGATILPFGANSYYSAAHESVRQQVNAYIKGGAFDGYIDFDAALTDGGNPPKLQTVYATWAQADGLHPGPAGYQKMGDTVDLSLFTK